MMGQEKRALIKCLKPVTALPYVNLTAFLERAHKRAFQKYIYINGSVGNQSRCTTFEYEKSGGKPKI